MTRSPEISPVRRPVARGLRRTLIIAYGGPLTISALAGSGGPFPPPTGPPEPPVAAGWPGNAAAGESGGAVDQIGWRTFFAEPALQAVIQQALENNRDLRIATLRVEQARAAWRIQRSGRFPTVGAEAGIGRGQTPIDLSVTGRSFTATQYSADLDLSWELDFWGRVRNLEGSALESFLATDEARQAATLSLTSAVARTWLQQRELDERIALADQTLTTRREAARIARRRHEIGSSSRFDMIQADSLLAQAEGERVALIQAREQTTNALTLLIGAPAPITALPLSQVETALSADLPAGLPSDLLITRPDIRAAEHQLRGANADIGVARAAYFPRIALTGLLGSATTDLDHLFDGTDNRKWTFAGGATAPIFNAGRIHANVAAARAQREIAVAQYERAIQSAFREVADGLAAQRGLTEQVEVRRRVLASLTERSRLAGLRYGSGAAAYIEVLDAERDRFAAEQALASARGALLANRVTLYAALGGGADLVEQNSGQARR